MTDRMEERRNAQREYNDVPMVRNNMPDTYRDDYRDIYRGYRHDRMNKETNAFRNGDNYKQYNSEDEVFACIVDHLTEAVMFHDRMMDLYGFLGLYGFKKMHEYQYFSESMERRKAKCYVLEHMNILVEDGRAKGLHDANLIPKNWYEFSRHDITPEAKKQCIEPSFEGYRQWEEETKELLSYLANELMYMGRMSDFKEVMEMVEDVDKELQKVEDMILKLKSVNFDMQYIMDMQSEVYEEYEHKLEKCFEKKLEKDKKEPNEQYQRRSTRTGRYMR